ncbi:MAG: hypothetical protein KAS39_05080, partial [Actinomycetia bacterium]|nr:hypothetical protein [Actinomycetes bacterium]
MKPVIVIPSYWGRESTEPFNPKDDVYDHPTPLNEKGTLERALDSFSILKDRDFRVVIIGIATHPSLYKKCESKLSKIIKKFQKSLEVYLFSYSELEKAKQYFSQISKGELLPLLSLKGYSNVRNMCLLSLLFLGSELLILFDDDEIMVDSDYISKAEEDICEEVNGKKVLGKAGYYLRPEGDFYKIPETEDPVEAEWGCIKAMNKAFQIISREPRLKPTPFAFGGNMVVQKELASKVAFDPFVTRGEDID